MQRGQRPVVVAKRTLLSSSLAAVRKLKSGLKQEKERQEEDEKEENKYFKEWSDTRDLDPDLQYVEYLSPLLSTLLIVVPLPKPLIALISSYCAIAGVKWAKWDGDSFESTCMYLFF